MPKIDVARLNALMPQPKPSDNPPEDTSSHSDDAAEPMEVDKAPMGRTLRKRKGKVANHLKREANDKEMESLQKRVFRIPLEKPFEEAYFTHILWMFFRDTRETEEDIRRMFYEAREKMKNRITLKKKKKNDPRKFAISYHLGLEVELSKESFTFVDFSQRSSGEIVRDLEVQIGNALVPVDFHVLDIKLNWNSSLLLGRAFLCNMQTNQLCLTLIDPHVHYNPIPVKKSQASSRRIDDPGLIAACQCGAEHETEYSASIETHTTASIDIAHQKSIDNPKEVSVDSSPRNYENDYYNPSMAAHTKDCMHTKEYDEDYEEERAIEYITILDEEDRLLHHSSWKTNAPSIDKTVSTSIDTHLHQTSQKQASTDIAYYPSIDTGVNRKQMKFMRVSHMRNFSTSKDVMKQINTKQKPVGKEHISAILTRESTARRSTTNINHQLTSVRNHHPLDPDGYARAIDGHALQISREDIADILQMANGAYNIFTQQCNSPAHQLRVTNEFYDTAGGIDNRLKQKYRHPTRPSIDVDIPSSIDRRPEFGKRAYDRYGTRRFYWEERDECGVYRDDQGHARDVDGHIIRVSKDDISSLPERASRDEYNYICLPEHASSFTQTKLMKLDGVYYPLNDSVSWLTTCMEEMRQDISRIQTQRAAEGTAPASIDRHHPTSIDDDPRNSHPMKSEPDFHTRAEIDQLVEEIYRTLETTEERLDRRCDDIYFPMDLTMSSLTSQIEAIQREIVEI
ncbi:hypothetical protein F2Q68_00011226 [Brassica cretica]|uniref:Uncharacterized protein n=1 Tax=Brassica cretica TaxID=69181 RepID=A0A8S9KWE1_BRACR|nr:hypothetical protein F2Q68_00011226 [Brassica cretica]